MNGDFDFYHSVTKELEYCDEVVKGYRERFDEPQNSELRFEEDQLYYKSFGSICGYCAEVALHHNIFNVSAESFVRLKQWVESEWFKKQNEEDTSVVRNQLRKTISFFIDGVLSIKSKAETGFKGLPTEFEIFVEIEEFEYEYDNGETYPYKKFIDHLILSLQIDIFNQFDGSAVKRALEINTKLTGNFDDSQIDKKYLDSLVEKVKFIALKFLLRSERGIVKITSNSSALPQFSGIESFKHSDFQALYEKIDYHYFGKNALKEKLFRMAKAKREDKGNLTDCMVYHALAKYYKDETKSYTDLKNLVDEYGKEIDSKLAEANDYDQFCLKINHLYFLNNLLSCRLERLESKRGIELNDFEEVFSDLDRITSYQDEYEMPNYFPYFKMVSCGVRILKIITSKSIDLVQDLGQLLERIEVAKDRMMETYQQMSYSFGQAFKLPSTECLFAEQQPLFIYSSFYLPIDYKLVRERDLGVALQELDSLRNFIKITNVLVEEKAKLQEEVRKTNQLLADTDKRSVEILSIFSAIVLFAIGSFKIFEMDLMKPELAFVYISTAGTTLFLFVFLVQWAISHDGQVLTGFHKVFFTSVFITNLFSILSLNGCWPFHKPLYIETIHRESKDTIIVERIPNRIEPKKEAQILPIAPPSGPSQIVDSSKNKTKRTDG